MIKKILTVIFIVLILGGVTFLWVDEDLPSGEEGARADWLADRMLESLHSSAWEALPSISWSFPPDHHFFWDKETHKVAVSWGEYRALINPDDRTGKVWQDDHLLEDGTGERIDEAISYFFNDSFWLIAPYKVKDPGAVRKLIRHEGKEALLVQYTRGGDTPGDSYLWLLDDDYQPVAWKLWVSILPIGGLEFTWEQWQNVDGARISTFHNGIIPITITNLN